MKPLHEKEIEEARAKLAEAGRDPDLFSFDVKFMEPDPDGGGMFTVRYEITVTGPGQGASAEYIGGIGLDWLAAFGDDLGEGVFG
ncbi:MAG: hypothetical protein KDE25_03510 [Novosphingobium sp.]|nr:hypothetical protein [Novosphingobium sp.]